MLTKRLIPGPQVIQQVEVPRRFFSGLGLVFELLKLFANQLISLRVISHAMFGKTLGQNIMNHGEAQRNAAGILGNVVGKRQ